MCTNAELDIEIQKQDCSCLINTETCKQPFSTYHKCICLTNTQECKATGTLTHHNCLCLIDTSLCKTRSYMHKCICLKNEKKNCKAEYHSFYVFKKIK